jgi:hypothetical protein
MSFIFRTQANLRDSGESATSAKKPSTGRVYPTMTFSVVKLAGKMYGKFHLSTEFFKNNIYSKDEEGNVVKNQAIVYVNDRIAIVKDGEGASLNLSAKGDKNPEFHATILESELYSAGLLPEPISKTKSKIDGVYTLEYAHATKASFLLVPTDEVQEGCVAIFKVVPFTKEAALELRGEATGEAVEGEDEGDEMAGEEELIDETAPSTDEVVAPAVAEAPEPEVQW